MNGLRRAGLLAALALLALAPSATAQINGATPSQWYKLPGLNAASGAQWVRAFAYSTPPNVVYAGLEGGGVFRSTNGGATWSAFNAGFPNPLTTNVRALLTSSTGDTVWAGTDTGVWKSASGGTWHPIAQGPEEDPAKPKKLNESVQSLISLPGNVMLAGVFSGGVFKSTDGGATWTPPPANGGMPTSETVYGFVGQPPQAPAYVLATTHNGVFASTDMGSTWTLASDGIPSVASPIQAWVDTSKPNLIYVSTGANGIYRSLNGGTTYAPINDGLGAVRARGFQIFTASQGAHLYAATEDGLWEALNSHTAAPPPPKWREVTQTGLHHDGTSNVIMWALTAPVIPGGGAFGLIAGTQSNGGYFLAFQPPTNACPANLATDTPSSHSACPDISDTTPTPGQTLTATTGTWTGTQHIDYAYQWQKCIGSGSEPSLCSHIEGEDEQKYIVREQDFNPDGNTQTADSYRFRVVVTATNPAPTFSLYRRYSLITGETAQPADTMPGYNQASIPDIDPDFGSVGDSFVADYGITPSQTTDGWFNPKATVRVWQWLRCTSASDLDQCDEIAGAGGAEPGGRNYTATTADGNHYLRVAVTGTTGSLSRKLISPATDSRIVPAPAALADPIVDPNTNLPVSQAPAVVGEPYVGETLAGTVGGWKNPTTEFKRRWVRCDADGTGCEYILKEASTDQEAGRTYVVRPADLGETIRLWVTADVNHDYSDDAEGVEGIDNHLPKEQFFESPQTAVVTYRPVPAPPGGGGGGGGTGGGVDTTAPTIQAASLTRTSFVAGKGTTFQIRISEPASVRIVISKATTGRRVGKACRPKTRKNRRKKKCKYQKTVTTIKRPLQPAGNVAIRFSGKIGRRKLRPGKYLATIVVTDASGNVTTQRLVFKIKRR